MKYEDLKNLKIEYKKQLSKGARLTAEQMEQGKLVIDGVYLVEVETVRVANDKFISTKLSGDYKLIHEGEELPVRVYFDLIRTPEDDISKLSLDADDIDWIRTPGFNVKNMNDDPGEELLINRCDEILHLLTLCEDWETLTTWIKSELRYRLSY